MSQSFRSLWLSDVHRETRASRASELVRRAKTGTEILYLPGNHDYAFRDLIGQELFGIPIRMEAIHETAGGERLLVTHGDLLDGRIRQGTNLERIGAAAYFLLSEFEVLVNHWRGSVGTRYEAEPLAA